MTSTSPNKQHTYAPFKTPIGWVRFVAADDGGRSTAELRFTVEKMSYTDEEIDINPDAIINATSRPTGVSVVHRREGPHRYTVYVGKSVYGVYEDEHHWFSKKSSGLTKAMAAISNMSALEWMTAEFSRAGS